MPFGLYNTLAIFITLMNFFFYMKSDEFMVVYIDGILVFFKNKKEYKLCLKIILKKLRDNQLFANLEKRIFFLEELEFLGHIINRDGLIQNSKKIEALKI